MPDLNQLPPTSQGAIQHSPSNDSSPNTALAMSSSPSPPHTLSPSGSHSLAAAAVLNSSLANESQDAANRPPTNGTSQTPSAQRRRSSIRMNLNINDPSLPGPGEMALTPAGLRAHPAAGPGSPSSGHHQRTPSLGELHQELENEQEAQVNRLLSMIRQQQAQIQHLQSSATPTAGSPTTVAVDDGTPTSERSLSRNQSAAPSQQNTPHMNQPSISTPAIRPRSPFHRPHSLSRHSSHRSGRSSYENSPSMRPMSSSGNGIHGESNDLALGTGASRDESAYYQAETQTLTRENQMLKLRIRELERQLSETNPATSVTHSPIMASNLHNASVPASAAALGDRDPPDASHS